MKIFIALCLAGAAIFSACSNNKPNPSNTDSTAKADSGAPKNAFFPVADYLEAEILHVDSSLLALKKFTTRNGHTDSLFIPVPEFNQLALQFVPRELADDSFEKNFTETAFQDKATRSIIFSYSPINAGGPLQRVDVSTVQGLRAQEVKSVYLEKTRVAGDSVILQKLFWKAQHNCQIVTIIRIKGKPDSEEQIRVVWDNTDETGEND